MKRSNTMHVNGEVKEFTDYEMREFFEDFLEGHTKAYYNLKETYRALLKDKIELEKKVARLEKELEE